MTLHRRITGKLVIATHNPGKLAEMRELLALMALAQDGIAALVEAQKRAIS